MINYLVNLECTYCSAEHSAERLQNLCRECGKVLYAQYDLASASKQLDREEVQTRPATMWRYFELLPVREERNIISLGEGFTPILKMKRVGRHLGCLELFVKDEGMNPTGSFKARGLSAAVSKAKELGATGLTAPSAGNAGSALAAYAASAGISASVFMPATVPVANRKEVSIIGSDLTLIEGHIGDAGHLARSKAHENGWFDLSTLQEPYRVEGKKTMGYEIAEQMKWQLPDVIIYPTGGGTGIVGMWKAFAELRDLGWIPNTMPKMFCVQPEGCAPIVRAFNEGAKLAKTWSEVNTVAAGLRVPAAIGDYLILNVLRDSGGSAVTVTDEDIMSKLAEVSRLEGLLFCPEGAATIAGLEKLLASGLVSSGERILLMNTGSGLKYLDLL